VNKKTSPQWDIEEDIEKQGPFDRGCLKKTKRSDLLQAAHIVGSRFQCKIKRYHAGDNRFKVKTKNTFEKKKMNVLRESCLRVGFFIPVRGRRGRWAGWPRDWGG
jgi:hypothetical protein